MVIARSVSDAAIQSRLDCFALLAVTFMRVDLFDFDLPAERIALRPAEPRDAARMLVVTPARRGAAAGSRRSAICPTFCAPGDVLVVNDTRVIPRSFRAFGTRGEAAAQIERTLHQARIDDNRWRAFARPAQET